MVFSVSEIFFFFEFIFFKHTVVLYSQLPASVEPPKSFGSQLQPFQYRDNTLLCVMCMGIVALEILVCTMYILSKLCNQIPSLSRAQPDWAYEFPYQTGLDTQICRMGPEFLNILNFFAFLKALKVRRPGRKTSGFRTVQILTIFQTFVQDTMSGRALSLSPSRWKTLTLEKIKVGWVL